MSMFQLSLEVGKLTRMAVLPSIPLNDILAEDLLYILPFPVKSDEALDPAEYKLTRKHTPK